MADPNNIQADVPYRTAIAERGKFFPVDTDYLTSVGYPASGEGKYAILTYPVVQPQFTLSGDIVLGAIELKDQDTDDRVNVIPLTNSNAMATMIVDSVGDQITVFVGSSDAAPGSPSADNITQIGGIAESTVPSAVSDGDAVATWFDTYGRQLLFGSNLSMGSIDVSLINDSRLNRIEIQLLNAVTADGASSSVDVSNYSNLTFHTISTGVVSGADVEIQSSLDGTNWVNINPSTKVISATGNTEESFSLVAYKYVRAEVANRIDGTYTVLLFGGN